MSYEDFATSDARLIILRELAKQTGGTLNETLLVRVLDTFGHRRSREWVRTQMRKLAELGAIHLTEAGSVLIAEITAAGLDHVQRRTEIDGVAKPSPER